MKRLLKPLNKPNWKNPARALLVLWVTTSASLPAQTFTSLHSFDGSDGESPSTALLQGSDGNFYGTTAYGGTYAFGTVFRMTPGGALTTWYSFCAQVVNGVCPDGAYPKAGLVQVNGDFYGTTYLGGANTGGPDSGCSNAGCGTVCKITPTGILTTLYRFCAQSTGNFCTDGAFPIAGLTEGTDGNLYGTTSMGGVNNDGTVFKITPSGALTTIHAFCIQPLNGACPDGGDPGTTLVLGIDGNFYGTGGGSIFQMTPAGIVTVLYIFCYQCTDGGDFPPALIQGADGYLYGTTISGGANGGGSVFSITPSGTLTTLYSFCSESGCPDGAGPSAGLVQGADGNFYGTTEFGGANVASGAGGGTVFQITPTGTLITLYSFCSESACMDGFNPISALVQGTNGDLYGTTSQGGTAIDCGGSACGTIFSLSLRASSPPEVNSGGILNSASYTSQGVAPGSIVSVFGTNLSASTAVASSIPLPTTLSDVTSVTFNGIPAGLYFVSQNQINAQLPFDVLLGQNSGRANIVVTRSSGASAPQSVTVAPASPGIFTTTANGLGQAFAYDNTTAALAAPSGGPIGSFATAPISISSGHALIIACTGLGSVNPSIGDYVAASDGILRYTVLTPTVLIGGVAAEPVYSVLSPQFVSEYQIGVIPAPTTPTGDAVSLQIQIGGVTTTNQVTIAVAP